MLVTSVGLASGVDVSVVDVTAPTGSVTLQAGQSGSIVINMTVTGNQAGTATFDVYKNWTLSGGTFAGSNPQTFTVPPRAAQDPATTFSTSGTVSVDAGHGTGTFTLAVSAFNITNDNQTGAKLSDGADSHYQVTVSAPPPPSDTTPPVINYMLTPASPDGNNGWYKSNVTLVWSVSDPESAFTKTNCVDQNITADQVATTYSCSATSAGGSAGPVNVTIKRDATAPGVSWTGSITDSASFVYGSVPAEPSCSATDALSGAGACAVSGYGSSVGSHTLTATAYDLAGNSKAETRSYTVDKANAAVVVTPYDVTYDGNPHTATGSATGVMGEDLSGLLDVSGTTHTNAGFYAGDSWSFGGNENYYATSGTVDDNIEQAPSIVTVTCLASVVYDGSAQTPCTAEATGVGMAPVDVTASLVYSNNTNAGMSTVEASWAGDSNHFGNSGSGSFEITKASSAVTVTCGGLYTYSGLAQTPCTAEASGVGMMPVDVTTSLVYANNTNAGTATADASWAGDDNHFGSTGSGSFAIEKADPTCTVTGYGVIFDNYDHTATGSCTGVLSESLSGLNLNGTTHKLVGDYNDTWNFTDVTGNYNNATGTVSDAILAWTLNGFYKPVDMGNVWNTVKNGSTVPLKFEIFAGTTELTDISAVKLLAYKQVACSTLPGSIEDAIETLSATGGTVLRYDSIDGQFIYNWKTPKAANTCYQVTMTTQDGSSLSAFFKLK